MHLLRLVWLLISVVNSKLEVKQLIIHTRHGARAPMYNVLSTFNNWWKDYYHQSELTTVGSRQQYLLGKVLRMQYKDVIPKFYNEEQVKIYSTTEPRAARSAQALFMGLFPKSENALEVETSDHSKSYPPGFLEPEFNHILDRLGNKRLPNRQPTYADLTTFNPVKDCLRIDALIQEAGRSETLNEFQRRLWDNGLFQGFIETFQKELEILGIFDIQHGDKRIDISLVGQFADSIICDEAENLDLPSTLNEQLKRQIMYVYHVQNLWMKFPNREVINLKANAQLLDLLTYSQTFNKGPRVVILSGHDGDVNNMLQFFGLQNPTFDFTEHERSESHHNAPFSSSLIIETVHDDTPDGYFIRIKYNGKIMNLPFCNNQQLCPLEIYQAYLKDNSLSEIDWDTTCKQTII